jgi:hypothetical protein
MAKETKVYPLVGHYLMGVPRAVHKVATAKDAEALEASGAFTTNPNHADRDRDADELDVSPMEHEHVRFLGEAPPGEEPEPVQRPAETGGSSDSEQE